MISISLGISIIALLVSVYTAFFKDSWFFAKIRGYKIRKIEFQNSDGKENYPSTDNYDKQIIFYDFSDRVEAHRKHVSEKERYIYQKSKIIKIFYHP